MAVHFKRRTGYTPCGLPSWRFTDQWLQRTDDKARVTCRRCRAFLATWPDAV